MKRLEISIAEFQFTWEKDRKELCIAGPDKVIYLVKGSVTSAAILALMYAHNETLEDLESRNRESPDAFTNPELDPLRESIDTLSANIQVLSDTIASNAPLREPPVNKRTGFDGKGR